MLVARAAMKTSDIQVLAVQGRNGRGELRRASITSRQQLLDEKEDLFSTLKGASMSASQFCYSYQNISRGER